MGPADSRRIPRAPRYSGAAWRSRLHFAYGAVTRSGHAFLRVPLWIDVRTAGGPTTPGAARDSPGLGSCAFARHYLRNRFYFLFLRVLRCFSSPGSLRSSAPVTGSLPPGFPIRTSAGHRAFAPHRGFSQLVTSFFASESHRHPPCALVRFLFAFIRHTRINARGALRIHKTRSIHLYDFSVNSLKILLVLRSHHVNDLFNVSRSPRQT